MAVFGPAPHAGESIGSRIPYLLPGWLVLTLYSVVWQYGVKSLILQQNWQQHNFDDSTHGRSSVIGGVILVTVEVLCKASWVGAWIYGLWLTHWGGRKGHQLPLTSQKRVMQSDRVECTSVISGNAASNARFRRCLRCTDTNGYGDRVYHCTKLDKHLPLYDHYCYFLWMVVYLDTMKPYLSFLFWVVADGVIVVVASIWAVSKPYSGLAYLHLVVAILSGIWTLYIALQVGCDQFKWLAARNVVFHEREIDRWTMARVLASSRGRRVQFVNLWRSSEDKRLRKNWNPWSLEPWENWRQALGERTWTWFCFWIQPRRVSCYGRWPGMESDLPLGELWRRFERNPSEATAKCSTFVEMPPVSVNPRRGIARSSGIEMV